MKSLVRTFLLISFVALNYCVAQVFESEPNGIRAQANELIFDASGNSSVTGKINGTSDIDVYKVKLPAFSGEGRLYAAMVPTSPDKGLNATLLLSDSQGNILQASILAPNGEKETLTLRVPSGETNYYIFCESSGSNTGIGAYRLDASFNVIPGIFGTIRKPVDPTDYRVNMIASGSPTPAIDPRKQTWIVIHGWNSSRTAGSIQSLANALEQKRPNDQILTLDWSSAADTGFDPTSAEDGIIPVAQWAASALVSNGFANTNLNLVGHSFGSYVADEIARRLPGGVNTIIALDPAADVWGGYSAVANDEVDFARDSAFSWAFHASSAGNEYTPARADEAFIVESGLSSDAAHSAVVLLFAYFVLNPTDPVAQFFLINSLLAGIPGPWLPNQFTSSFALDDPVTGYEAVISSTNNGTQPLNVSYKPRPRLFISNNYGLITLAWPTNYSTFVLEGSSAIGAGAKWEAIFLPVMIEGASNIIRLHDNLNRSFRLRLK